MEKLEEDRLDNENEEKVMFEYSNVGEKREKTMKPVRPKSSFMNYYISHCQLPAIEKPKMTAEARRELGAKWKNLPAEEKAQFLNQTEAQKEQYKLQLEEYKKQRADEETKVKCYAPTRCSPYNLFKLFQQLKKRNKDAAVETLGFSGLLELRGRSLKRDLCEWLVQNFDVPSSSMNLHGQSIPLTVDDVSSILGLQNEGSDVSTSGNREQANRLCKMFNFPMKSKLTFGILEKEMLVLDGESDGFKARLLLYIVGRFLCPSTDWGPSPDYYFCLNEDGLTGKLNWAKHAHEKLLDSIKSFHSRKDKSYLTGCVLLLEIKYFDHLSRVGCKIGFNPSVVPRIAAWGKEDVAKFFSHVKDFREPFKAKDKGVAKQTFPKRMEEDENIPDHSSLLGIQQEMKRLNEHVHTLTESVTTMAGNMKYMTALVMSYATTMEAMKEFINSSRRNSVEVNEQGETSVKNPIDEVARRDISPQSKNTEFTQDTVINKTDVLHNRYEPNVDKLGCDARNPIAIVTEIKSKDVELVTPIAFPLKRPSSNCPAPRKRKDAWPTKTENVRSTSTIASPVHRIMTRSRSNVISRPLRRTGYVRGQNKKDGHFTGV